MNHQVGGRGITRNSGGFTVQVWPLPMVKKSKKSLDKTGKKHRLGIDSNEVFGKEKQMEFEGRDGNTYIAAYFKRAEVWNVHQITRKIVVSCMASGVIESEK